MKSKWWVKELDLYTTEKEELANDQLLSDKHVLAAVMLLKREFPEITGNQSTLLGQTKSFQQMGEGSIQIHHDNTRKHWVTSTIKDSEVIVYDSKSIRALSEDIKDQLKSIYGSPRLVAIPRMSQHVVFCQKSMRDHLIKCFDARKMMSFPHTPKRAKRTVFDYQHIE